MTPAEPPVKRRAYRSPLREERARANKTAILSAARDLFVRQGYPATSVSAVAEAAGVSEDLVYRHFPTKRALLLEALAFSATGSGENPPVLQQAGPQAVRAERDPRRQVERFAASIAERTALVRPVDDVMLSAALVDEQVAQMHQDMHRERLEHLTTVVGWFAATGPLRDGLDLDAAATTVWALTGPPMHRVLVDGRGWDQERYAQWLRDTLVATLRP